MSIPRLAPVSSAESALSSLISGNRRQPTLKMYAGMSIHCWQEYVSVLQGPGSDGRAGQHC